MLYSKLRESVYGDVNGLDVARAAAAAALGKLPSAGGAHPAAGVLGGLAARARRTFGYVLTFRSDVLRGNNNKGQTKIWCRESLHLILVCGSLVGTHAKFGRPVIIISNDCWAPIRSLFLSNNFIKVSMLTDF